MKVALSDIDTHGRIREPDADRVEALADSMDEVGLLNPVTVARAKIIRGGYKEVDGFRLIAGGHRVLAAAYLGWSEIQATIVDLDEQQRIIAECDENLCVAQLSPSERALFTAKRKEAYLALHPETANGKNSPKEDGKVCRPPSFADDQSAKTGTAARTVRLDAERGESVSMSAAAMLKGTKLDTGVFLDRLKGVPEAEQVAYVQRHLNPPKPPAVPRDKVEIKSDAEVVADEVADMVRRWNKLSPEARAMFLDEIDTPIMGAAV